MLMVYLKIFDVTITTTKTDFSDAVFELSADAASINTEVEMRDNDLKSANFFDVATYPKITFKSTSIKPNGQNKYKLAGNLTMHGVTKPIVFLFRAMPKGDSYLFVGGFAINRLDFGVGRSSSVLSNSVKVSLSVLVKKS